MPPALPRRLIGYGAYNLCFDKLHGRAAGDTTGPNFFQAVRQRLPAVNLVRVFVFRNSGIEGLRNFPGRRLPLYTAERVISDAFMNNLRALVDAAASLNPMFFVQVCIFSYHSVAHLDKIPNTNPVQYNPNPREQPENIPYALVPPPGQVLTNPIDYARWWFGPGTNARTSKQKELVARLGQKLAGCPNVIWEIGNELRIKDDDNHLNDHRALAQWVNQMREALVQQTGPDINVTCSTGIHNEGTMLRNVPLNVFDFHSGQWTGENYRHWIEIPRAKQRAAEYNANARLIIDDDGINDEVIPRNRPNVAAWAKTAFENGLHYSTKGSYPPAENFSDQQLGGLRDANNAVP
jgi:hypothetical protein